MDLKETDILGDRIGEHWYYRSKAQAMARMLQGLRPASVLDVGAGSGFFSKLLLKTTALREAWCVDISYDGDSDAVEAGKPIHFRQGIGANQADLVLLMDVLEHVDDDVALLCDYVAKASSGTHFLISVPAFQALWSAHDVFLEHKRRYTLPQLESSIHASGLQIERSAYYFGLVLPLAATMRLAERLRSGTATQPRSQLSLHHPVVNRLLSLTCALELPWMRWNRVGGLTAFCLARKP